MNGSSYRGPFFESAVRDVSTGETNSTSVALHLGYKFLQEYGQLLWTANREESMSLALKRRRVYSEALAEINEEAEKRRVDEQVQHWKVPRP